MSDALENQKLIVQRMREAQEAARMAGQPQGPMNPRTPAEERQRQKDLALEIRKGNAEQLYDMKQAEYNDSLIGKVKNWWLYGDTKGIGSE